MDSGGLLFVLVLFFSLIYYTMNKGGEAVNEQ